MACLLCVGFQHAVLAQTDVVPVASETESVLRQVQLQARLDALAGAWITRIGDRRVTLRLEADGRFELDGREGRYEVTEDALHLATPGEVTSYRYQFVDGQLELSGGDLREAVVLRQEFELRRYFARKLDLSWEGFTQRLSRIGVILVIVAAAGLLIALLKRASRWLIFAQRGVVGRFYRHQKHRSQTLHSLVLNIAKYFIYLTALGMILSELGVNYMAYIASLSVVGLAIGFGSQGLVQDMVTGFFVILEGQFDVGDMVEVSGQTGIVTELGLRMTRLRTYQGQTVVIPNRNIATVSNYIHGGQHACIDIPVAAPEVAERARPVVRHVAEQCRSQFEGIILQAPQVDASIKLADGEHVVRLHLWIWPNQTWIIDQQISPRLREALSQNNLNVTGDRLSVAYYAKPTETLGWWRNRRNPPSLPGHSTESGNQSRQHTTQA